MTVADLISSGRLPEDHLQPALDFHIRTKSNTRHGQRGTSPMTNTPDLEELKERGAGRPAPDDVVSLYRRAFREFGRQSLWSRRPSEQPTIAQVLVVADSLRRDGSMRSRPLAAQIEAACRAAL
jgi:hypothetical protein